MSTIDEVFDGEWKSPEEYLIKCPYCGDHTTHNHCYVNIVKGKFICHRCGEAGVIARLLRDHGDGEQVEREPGMVEKTRYEEVDINSFKLVTGMSNTIDRMALTYLTERGFSKKELSLYDVRFSDFGRYYGRVMFPIVEFGEYVSFISRSFMDKVHPPYLFPHHGETKLTTNECLWGWDQARKLGLKLKQVILTEGIIDAVAINRMGYFGMSLHSKQLGDGQLLKLLRLSKTIKFIVMLDGDAKSDGLKVAKKLYDFGRDVEMSLLHKEEDPDMLSKSRLEHVLVFNTLPVDVNLAMQVYLGG